MSESSQVILDNLDREILKILSNNGSISHRKIATKLKKSPVTISKRIKGLEEKGIINGYTININYEKLGYDFEKESFEKLSIEYIDLYQKVL